MVYFVISVLLNIQLPFLHAEDMHTVRMVVCVCVLCLSVLNIPQYKIIRVEKVKYANGNSLCVQKWMEKACEWWKKWNSWKVWMKWEEEEKETIGRD